MSIVEIYNRLIYRDVIGYCIPGSICTLLMSISFFGYKPVFSFLSNIDFTKLLLLLMLGGLISHVFAVIVWYLPKRGELTDTDLQKIFAGINSGCLNKIYKEGFEEKIGQAVEEYSIKDQFVLAYSWLNANEMRNEIVNRYESLANLFEISRLSIPFSILTMLFYSQIYHDKFHILSVILVALLTACVCHLGFKQMLYREATQIMQTFIRHSLKITEK